MIDLLEAEEPTAEVRVFIAHISTVVVQVTFVRGRDTAAVVTRELIVSTGTISTIQLVATV